MSGRRRLGLLRRKGAIAWEPQAIGRRGRER